MIFVLEADGLTAFPGHCSSAVWAGGLRLKEKAFYRTRRANVFRRTTLKFEGLRASAVEQTVPE